MSCQLSHSIINEHSMYSKIKVARILEKIVLVNIPFKDSFFEGRNEQGHGHVPIHSFSK